MTTETMLAGQPFKLSLPAALTLTALLLGIAADYLFWPEGPRNTAQTLWLALFSAAIIGFNWHQQTPWRQSVTIFCALPLLASLLLLFRDADILQLTMLGILFTTGLQILLRTAGISFSEAKLSHFIRAFPSFPMQAALGMFPVLAKLDIGGSWGDPRTRGIIRGLLLALPLLFVFSLLFSSADEGFSRYMPDLSTFFNSDTPAHLALIALFFVISGGLLAGVLKTRSLASIDIAPGKLGTEETAVILGLLSMLFVAFVLLQLSYLFGGQEMITATTGLTLAEYARRGFFELLWVAVLTLALLLITAKISSAAHLVRLFGSIMVLCVLIMLVSAAQRMALYIDSFGLSVDRIVASTVMAWIACCLALCAVTVLAGKERGFASGMANLGIGFCFVLILLNPGRLVATVNIERSLETQQALDVSYLLGRGTDVIAPLLERFDELPLNTQLLIAVALHTTPFETRNGVSVYQPARSWRDWNYSRQNAWQLIENDRPKLQRVVDTYTQEFLESRPPALSPP